jgi:hypothetical protein
MNKLVRYAWFGCAMFAAIVLLGAVPVYYNRFIQPISTDPYGLGPFNATFQVLFYVGDLGGSFMSFALAILLFWRKPSERVALFVSFTFLAAAVMGSRVFDHVLTAYLGAPSTYEFWSNLQTPLWMLLWCIFPDGRFVPRWARWLFAASVASTLVIFTSGVTRTIIVVGIFGLFTLATYAQVYRYRRVSSYAERQQTKWWLYGLFVMFLFAFVASLIYKELSPPLLNPLPIFITIAILRSHLWDIDIIIRRTLVYGALTAMLALVYLGSVVVLQEVLRSVTWQTSDLAIIASTLAIAALFSPLRRRVQQVIDQRFYRRKFDAQQVLARFAQTARDETDLNKLTDELIRVVDETMQPESASLWLKKADNHGRRMVR